MVANHLPSVEMGGKIKNEIESSLYSGCLLSFFGCLTCQRNLSDMDGWMMFFVKFSKVAIRIPGILISTSTARDFGLVKNSMNS